MRSMRSVRCIRRVAVWRSTKSAPSTSFCARPNTELGEAQHLVGMAYAEGKIVPTDVARAAEWFREGAAQGHEDCQLQLFLMQKLGVEIPEDAVLGRWALMATAEPVSPAEATSEETDSSDEEEGPVSEEYLAHLLTVFENYKRAARKRGGAVGRADRARSLKVPSPTGSIGSAAFVFA